MNHSCVASQSKLLMANGLPDHWPIEQIIRPLMQFRLPSVTNCVLCLIDKAGYSHFIISESYNRHRIKRNWPILEKNQFSLLSFSVFFIFLKKQVSKQWLFWKHFLDLSSRTMLHSNSKFQNFIGFQKDRGKKKSNVWKSISIFVYCIQ